MKSISLILLFTFSFVANSFCDEIAQEYGVPFDKYGLPEHAPEERTIELPEVREVGEVLLSPPEKTILVRDDKNQYSLGYQGPEGTEVKEQGTLISTDNGWEYVIAKTGSYRYISPEGIPVNVEWIADEKGFRILNA